MDIIEKHVFNMSLTIAKINCTDSDKLANCWKSISKEYGQHRGAGVDCNGITGLTISANRKKVGHYEEI